MNKINILLIDDNPSTFSTLKNLENSDAINAMKCFLQTDCSSDEIMKKTFGPYLNEIPLFNSSMKLSDYFELKWIYSDKAAKNYFNAMIHIEKKYGYKEAYENGYVPDIIVIDYDFSQVKYAGEPGAFVNEFVKKKLDTLHSLEDFFKNKRDDFEFEKSPYTLNDGTKDRKGLFCGALIVNKFKYDTPCCGLPCTIVGIDDIDRTDPGFFEWFLKEDFKKAFESETRIGGETGKTWELIVNAAMPIYKKSILDLIKLNKIRVDLNELIDLLDGRFLKKDDGEREYKCFSFRSVYGKRKIPLDGLFIDKDATKQTNEPKDLPEGLKGKHFTERDVAIWEFVNEIKEELVKLANLGIGIKEFIRAKGIAEAVWSSYIKDFESRMYLSEYSFKGSNRTEEETNEYGQLLKYFFVTKKTITDKDTTIEVETIRKTVSISNFNKKEDKLALRLAILYLVSLVSIRLSKCFSQSPKVEYDRLADEEFFYILNPVISSEKYGGLILPMHSNVPFSKYSEAFTKDMKRKIIPPENVSIFNFKGWIRDGERIIMQSFFNEDKSILPDWLK